MSNHLSADQFAKCVVGQPAKIELAHLAECRECSAELDRFGKGLLRFRGALRSRIDDRVALGGPDILAERPAEAGIPLWRWVLVAAGVVAVVVLPFFVSAPKPQEPVAQVSVETDPDAIMNRVNAHLSRLVPAPMEAMMPQLSDRQSMTESGGIQ